LFPLFFPANELDDEIASVPAQQGICVFRNVNSYIAIALVNKMKSVTGYV